MSEVQRILCDKGHPFWTDQDTEQDCPVCQSMYGFDPNRKIVNIRKKEIIPSDIRWAVWERDNFTCQKCGSRRNLAVDHIHPESKGGKLEMSNLQTLCKSCNSSKRDKV